MLFIREIKRNTASNLVKYVYSNKPQKKKPYTMKFSKKTVQSKTHSIPNIQFQAQQLTSFSGVTLLQVMFQRIDLKNKLTQCFRHLNDRSLTYSHGMIVLLLVVHLFLGKRRLQEIRYYKNDPMVLRLMGLSIIPDCATVSRRLSQMDFESVENIRQFNRDLVLGRLLELNLNRLTLDFDGSVLSTGRYAEGTAVGYNKKKKGQRSYYPLNCTLAQTGQVLDVWHRPGNVHDSNGAKAFILSCINRVRACLPNVNIEVRMDSAFFSEEIVDLLTENEIEFSISVPFARYTQLKSMIEGRKRWRRLDETLFFFESNWQPKSWNTRYRFVFVREWTKQQNKKPVQLDLFTPYEYEHEFKVIITNKKLGVKKLINFHNGRGYQENLFAELKSQVQMDYIPTRTLAGNQVYLMASIIVHNINREMQMVRKKPERNTTEKRTPLWVFEKIDSVRRNLIQIAGRLTSPQGKLTLTMNANAAVEQDMSQFMNALAA